MDTVTLLLSYSDGTDPHVVTIDRKHLALVLAVSRARAPFAVTDTDGNIRTIHPRALARVMVVEGENA